MKPRKRKPKVVVEHGLPVYAHDSDEAKAIRVLHDIVGRTRAFFAIFRRAEGVTYVKPMTVQLTTLSQAPAAADWKTLSRQNAGSWEEFLRTIFDAGVVRQHLREGSKAPWPWPPSIDGRIYTDPGGPPPLTNEDIDALASEGQR